MYSNQNKQNKTKNHQKWPKSAKQEFSQKWHSWGILYPLVPSNFMENPQKGKKEQKWMGQLEKSTSLYIAQNWLIIFF